ncbi:hypothetical protein A3844_15005 [Paenibacillus helianthi]|uniref:Immunity protein 30 domain-containing protein n=1 Tax=Paenibacillus helianthi TaxID=1349432 RepID=A0ABX3ER98_9BACL|nr:MULTISPECIES: Imm47 family immunity protein [Paenibacillus]OKP86059.1 hypothetical protein A3844_15005 [Paenibacillus helianthi]OKP86577.1 hypothetical protein A3848_21445 [Paenibacillus sp. P32E]
MGQSSNLIKSNWYGEKNSSDDIASLRNSLKQATTEHDNMLLIIDLLKLGDFTVKEKMLQIMNTTKDENIMNLCIRLFCSVASHKDLLNSGNLLFLSDLSEYNADTFAASALYTLSYDAVPYLLAMLEEWEDTNVEGTIRNSLDIFLNYSDELTEEAPVEEIGNFYLDYIKKVELDNYYYYGDPAFPGSLAKKIIEKSVISLNNTIPIQTNVIPSLLSIWSGVKCPVQYDTIVDVDQLGDVYRYVDIISKMEWEIGSKYFYGHRVL